MEQPPAYSQGLRHQEKDSGSESLFLSSLGSLFQEAAYQIQIYEATELQESSVKENVEMHPSEHEKVNHENTSLKFTKS